MKTFNNNSWMSKNKLFNLLTWVLVFNGHQNGLLSMESTSISTTISNQNKEISKESLEINTMILLLLNNYNIHNDNMENNQEKILKKEISKELELSNIFTNKSNEIKEEIKNLHEYINTINNIKKEINNLDKLSNNFKKKLDINNDLSKKEELNENLFIIEERKKQLSYQLLKIQKKLHNSLFIIEKRKNYLNNKLLTIKIELQQKELQQKELPNHLFLQLIEQLIQNSIQNILNRYINTISNGYTLFKINKNSIKNDIKYLDQDPKQGKKFLFLLLMNINII